MNEQIEALKAQLANAQQALIDAVIDYRLEEFTPDTGSGGGEPDPDPDPVSPADKKTFIIMKHHGQPDLGQFGLEQIKMHYESAVTSGGNPDKGKLQNAARASQGLVVLDIESWADHDNSEGNGYWRVDDGGVAKYIQALKWYREAMPAGHQVGLYSIMPVRNLWDAISPRDSSRFTKWQGWNDEVAPIAPHVDVMFPSCYTFNQDRGQWVTYAKAQIDEAKRISGGKAVFPVLWPQYHPGKGPIEGAFWRLQLETCMDFADGFLIWDDWRGNRTDFNKLPDWWPATVDFMAAWR